MLKKLSGFNFGKFFAIKVAPEFPKKSQKNCPLIWRKKSLYLIVVVVDFLPYTLATKSNLSVKEYPESVPILSQKHHNGTFVRDGICGIDPMLPNDQGRE